MSPVYEPHISSRNHQVTLPNQQILTARRGLADFKLSISPKSLASLPSQGISSTELGLFIQKVRSRFPNEIVRLVYDYTSPSYFSALASCLHTVGWRSECNIQSLKTYSSRLLLDAPLPAEQKIEKLGAKFCCIMGEYCLTEISADSTVTYDKSIVLPERKRIRGMYVILAMFGITDLRLQYQDRTYSSWLSQHSSKWMDLLSVITYNKSKPSQM